MDCSQAAVSIFLRQEFWSGMPFSFSTVPNPGIKPLSPALAGRFFTTEPPGKPWNFQYFPVNLGLIAYFHNSTIHCRAFLPGWSCLAEWILLSRAQQIKAYRLSPAHCWVLYGPWAKNCFYIFKWLKITKRISWRENFLKFLGQCPQVRFYWSNIRLILLRIILGCFHITKAGLGSCHREDMVYKSPNIYNLPLIGNILLKLVPIRWFLNLWILAFYVGWQLPRILLMIAVEILTFIDGERVWQQK